MRYDAPDPCLAALHLDHLQVTPPLIPQNFNGVRGQLAFVSISKAGLIDARKSTFAELANQLPGAEAPQGLLGGTLGNY